MYPKEWITGMRGRKKRIVNKKETDLKKQMKYDDVMSLQIICYEL